MLAEHVAMVLAARVGRSAAQRVVQAAAGRVSGGGGRPFREELLADPEVTAHLTPADVDAALDPAGYLGSTPALVERALAAHRDRARSRST
jgi:3-carboxy-cis,cis-muconate cycloisomerase